ncbi:hypothetical protein G9U51_08910 [Calidifontibacter sp. DB0510]|uniref:Uncharacterized protein n=1 Tax=Metallococcus carri TaxID=1656884 RepID=A0A967E924_9MICO|nr:hypothetical protein [Metallococcus carri]NHN55892.1 hypothetical protein [Metallococcus carri]NOP38420.1 hypothetical protein [Calidifontibacter sp. DB2511S]
MPAEWWRRWVKRGVGAVVAGAAFWFLAGLAGWHAPLAVVLAVAVAAVAIGGYAADTGPQWPIAMPTVDPAEPHYRGAQEARLFYLRRISEDATSRAGQLDTGRASPVALQRGLRAVARHRVATRTGIPLEADDLDGLARALDPVLARYLCTQPPPPINPAQLTDVIHRIEEL